MTNSDIKVGDKVYFGRNHGEQTLGEVVKVNRVKVKVRQLESRGTQRDYAVGTVWTVPVSLLRRADDAGNVVPEPPKPKRPDSDILSEIRGIYCRLSPENLWCDGEASLSQVRRMGAMLRRRLAECERELGRKVSESEAFSGC